MYYHDTCPKCDWRGRGELPDHCPVCMVNLTVAWREHTERANLENRAKAVDASTIRSNDAQARYYEIQVELLEAERKNSGQIAQLRKELDELKEKIRVTPHKAFMEAD